MGWPGVEFVPAPCGSILNATIQQNSCSWHCDCLYFQCVMHICPTHPFEGLPIGQWGLGIPRKIRRPLRALSVWEHPCNVTNVTNASHLTITPIQPKLQASKLIQASKHPSIQASQPPSLQGSKPRVFEYYQIGRGSGGRTWTPPPQVATGCQRSKQWNLWNLRSPWKSNWNKWKYKNSMKEIDESQWEWILFNELHRSMTKCASCKLQQINQTSKLQSSQSQLPWPKICICMYLLFFHKNKKLQRTHMLKQKKSHDNEYQTNLKTTKYIHPKVGYHDQASPHCRNLQHALIPM